MRRAACVPVSLKRRERSPAATAGGGTYSTDSARTSCPSTNRTMRSAKTAVELREARVALRRRRVGRHGAAGERLEPHQHPQRIVGDLEHEALVAGEGEDDARAFGLVGEWRWRRARIASSASAIVLSETDSLAKSVESKATSAIIATVMTLSSILACRRLMRSAAQAPADQQGGDCQRHRLPARTGRRQLGAGGRHRPGAERRQPGAGRRVAQGRRRPARTPSGCSAWASSTCRSIATSTMVIRGLFIKATPVSRINMTSSVEAVASCVAGRAEIG